MSEFNVGDRVHQKHRSSIISDGTITRKCNEIGEAYMVQLDKPPPHEYSQGSNVILCFPSDLEKVN